MIIKGKNINELFVKTAKELIKAPEISPRNQPTKELINATLVLENTLDNVLTLKSRDLNLNYLKGELAFYFSKSRFLKDIIKYSKFWAQCSNDNRTLNSAYGFIIMKQKMPNYSGSQLDWCVESLEKDKDSRQAIMNYNQPKHKMRGQKDMVCLRKNTFIHSPEGNITIGRLSKKFKKGLKKYPIWSLNRKTNNIELDWCINAFKQPIEKKLIRIYFNDNSYLDCTEEHKILIKIKKGVKKNKKIKVKYKWKCAKDLNKNDMIVPIRYVQENNGYDIIKNINQNWHNKNRIKPHREYWKFLYGKIPKDYIVHHINLCRTDNKEKNLLCLSFSKHRAIHQVLNNSNSKIFVNLKIRNKKTGYNVDKYLKYLFKNKNKINKVKSIKKLYRTFEVYDLIVKKNHNFFVNNGLCVHNCTMNQQFLIRDNKLITIVNMRSNDLIYGTSYDMPFFSLVQQYVTNALRKTYKGLENGTYYHNAASLHVYKRHYGMLNKMARERTNRKPAKQLIWTKNGEYKIKDNVLNIFE